MKQLLILCITATSGISAQQEIGAFRFDCQAVKGKRAAEGDRLTSAGRFAEARAEFEAALEVEKQCGSSSAENLARLMSMIGFAELQNSRPAFAITWFRQALDQKPISAGVAARITSHLAAAYLESYDLQLEATARQALRLAENAFGPEHPETFLPQSTIAGLYVLRGDFARAEPLYRRLLYQAEKTLGPNAYEVAVYSSSLATAYLYQARYSQARAFLEKAIAGFQQNPATTRKDEIPLCQATLALTYASEGRAREAHTLLDSLFPSVEEALGSRDPSFVPVFVRIALTRFRLKTYDAGREMFERAIAILEGHYGKGSAQAVESLRLYAGALRQIKDKTRAKQIAARLK